MPQLPPRQQATQKFPVVGEREPSPEALDLQRWRLTISGEVAQPHTWTYAEVQQLPQIEVTHDMHCVTRWSRLGCRWRGVALTTIAALVEPTPAARFVQCVAYSPRQHDASLPMHVCLQEGALLAWEMDGEALSVPHGYPLRLVVPSRYLYKSVKWVREIRFLSQDVLGYWERVGGYHNGADFWREERYVSGNLSPQQVERLRATADVRPYQQHVLLSLDLRQVHWPGAHLAGAQLKNCTLAGSDLRGADLRGANLTNSDLQGANLRGADLSDADLEGVLLMGADLRDCSMRRARLAAAEFWREGLPAAMVAGLDIHGAAVDDLLEDQQVFLRQQHVVV
ncbi:MAG: nitrate reductase [Candidatus Tectomicrobia bacterium]|uniref:Nitrate reductase n=1 Tax=Tectimicrobiota bacterium TaxID=2528274 RepID=A0A937VZA2_UNCTE|nr:nitrate reductase [Candidatus Tectomicrobia bacterium]